MMDREVIAGSIDVDAIDDAMLTKPFVIHITGWSTMARIHFQLIMNDTGRFDARKT